MKKKIIVYFTPVTIEIDLKDDLDNDEIEEELNWEIYDKQVDYLKDKTQIDYWELI